MIRIPHRVQQKAIPKSMEDALWFSKAVITRVNS